MMKSVFRLLLAAVCALALFASSAQASAFPERVPVIQDDADLLTEEEEAALYQDMLPLCEYGTPLFWTSYETGNYEKLADRFYHARLSRGENGMLFAINMASRQLTVFTDGDVYRIITRSEAETITDNVFRMASAGNYYQCAKSVYEQIGRRLRGEQIARPMQLISNALLSLVLALMLVYLYISGRYESRPAIGKAGAAVPVTAAGTAAAFAALTMNSSARMTKQTKTDISSHSGGGHGGGGGGFGGGGSSGGGGSHGF